MGTSSPRCSERLLVPCCGGALLAVLVLLALPAAWGETRGWRVGGRGSCGAAGDAWSPALGAGSEGIAVVS